MQISRIRLSPASSCLRAWQVGSATWQGVEAERLVEILVRILAISGACLSAASNQPALKTPLLSMPIEYSPKVPTENSSLRYGSIAAVATRRLDIGEDIKIEIGDGVQGLGSGAVAEAVWQGVAPGGVFGL